MIPVELVIKNITNIDEHEIFRTEGFGPEWTGVGVEHD